MPFYDSVWVGKPEPPRGNSHWGEKGSRCLSGWFVGGWQGTPGWGPLPQGGRPVLLLPPSYGKSNLFPRAILPTCAHAMMEVWLQRREAGSSELEFGGSISIPARDTSSVMQLLGIKTLTSETLIGSRKVFQGCCGRMEGFCATRSPSPGLGYILGRESYHHTPPAPKTSQWFVKMVPNMCGALKDLYSFYSPASEICLGVSQSRQWGSAFCG